MLSTNRIVIIGSETPEHRRCIQILNEGGYGADIISMAEFSQSADYVCTLIDSNELLSKKWQEVRSEIPVIALLDSVSTPRSILYDRGVNDYVLKPVYAGELLFRISTAIQYTPKGSVGVSVRNEQTVPELHEVEVTTNRKEVALVERTCVWLEERLSQKHQLDDIAIALGTNRSKLAALFKRYLNMGVFEWLTDQRMLKARSLVLGSDLTIQEIGFEVGYINCGHFATAYKKQFQLTASQQRKQRTCGQKRLIQSKTDIFKSGQ
jgi:AraC-like DNA-binding protein